MATCPLCEATIDGDFGLMECSGCGAQLLVHVDGRVESQGEAQVPDLAGSQVIDQYSEPPPVPGEGSDVVLQIPMTEMPIEDGPAEPIEEVEATPTSPSEYSFDDESPLEPVTPAYVTASTPDSPDMSDVANFGNSGVSGGRDGSLRYTLTIDGIDTSDVRNAFREAITDRKLMWDIETILKSVRNGQVTIQNVSPSKAFMVISRLRSLPVRIQWEQYAVHQT